MLAAQSKAPLELAATLASQSSGSTVFAFLLARHSQLSSDGEIFPLDHLDSALCSCGQKQVDCPYYREAAGHMLAQADHSWDPTLFAPHPRYSRFGLVDKAVGRLWGNRVLQFGQGILRRLPPWRRQEREFIAAHIRFMENSLRIREATVYVDGSKFVRRAALFANHPGVRLKVIHLVRDGRGFCWSFIRNHKLQSAQLPLAARTWLWNLEIVERFHTRWPHVPLLIVRYEDLCRDLPGTLQRVCRFLDVPYETSLETGSDRPSHVMGNSMRLTFSGQVSECRRWAQEFAAQDIAYLNRTLSESLQRYGYM
jgi:hypothetical protein